MCLFKSKSQQASQYLQIFLLPLVALWALFNVSHLALASNGDLSQISPNQVPLTAVTAVDCGLTSWVVTDTTSLNEAIGCFNSLGSGSGVISITADITLTAASTTITNSNASLLIAGNGHHLSGDDLYRTVHIGAGDVAIEDLTITNGFALNDNGGGLLIESGGLFTLTNSTVRNNRGNSGGGLYITEGINRIEQSTILNNESVQFSGGGLVVADGAHVIIDQTSILSNTATARGGGIRINNTSFLTITNSTFYDNYAKVSGGALFAGDGFITITNSTISGNLADTEGGGIFINNAANIELFYSTVVSNTAVGSSGDGLFISGSGSVGLTSTLLAHHSDDNCSGTPTDNGYNIADDTTCSLSGTSTSTTADLLLSPLADNGGETWTHALQTGSPAIDVIPSATADCGTIYTTDQRGIARPQNNNCDTGAYEYPSLCFPDSYSATSQAELDSAIICYNAALSGAKSISLTSDILLASSLTTIDNSNGATLQLEGNGHSLDGNNARQLFNIKEGLVTMNQITLTQGVGGNGGAVYVNSNGVLTMTESHILNSFAVDSGGGIYLNSGANLTLQSSEFTNNSVGREDGGGLYIGDGATSTVENSAIYSNETFGGRGGGIAINQGELNMFNSAIYSNESPNLGGAIFNQGGTVNLSNSTVSNNIASGLTGTGIYAVGYNQHVTVHLTQTTVINNGDNNINMQTPGSGTGSFVLHNSLVSGSEPYTNCTFTEAVQGSIAKDVRYSMSPSNNCVTDGVDGNIVTADPQIGSLQDNSGETWSHLPNSGSPLIDAIPLASCSLSTDQRGIARPQGARCDIGSVERSGASAVTPTVSISLTLPTTITIDWTEDGANQQYDLYRHTSPYSGHTLQTADVTPPVSYTDDGTNYFYFVRAIGGNGSTADSNEIGLFHFELTPGN